MRRTCLLILLLGAVATLFAENPAAGSPESEPLAAPAVCSDVCPAEPSEVGCGSRLSDPGDGCRCCDSGSLLRWLDLHASGHLNQGVNVSSHGAANLPGGFGNLPAAGLPYRANDYMLNQLYVALERPTGVADGGWGIGGRIDLAFGADYIFLRSRGLETYRDFANKWNSDSGSGLYGRSLYGLAMPQLYAEIATDRVTVRLGHFYSLFGHEELLPTQNFYYTNSYALFYNGYGESAPVTGLQAQYQLSEQLLLAGELHRGQVNWEDNNDRFNVMGLVEWTNKEGDLILCYSFDVGPQDDAGANAVFAQSAIIEWQFTKTSSYVLNSSYGFEKNVADGGGTGQWYGFANYLARDLTEQWTAGVRYELFANVDGVRTLALSPFTRNAPGTYHEITAGLNYRPRPHLTIRPEVRWDWFDAGPGVAPGPFGNGTARNQFLFAVDLLLTF